jgi:hypothetical protein
MKLASLLLALLALLGFCGHGLAQVPANLEGVWAPDHASFNGQLLTEGEALYLLADGRGALAFVMRKGHAPGGPAVSATFDPRTNKLTLNTFTDSGAAAYPIVATYDSETRTIRLPSQMSNAEPGQWVTPFRRRFSALDPAMRTAMGIDARSGGNAHTCIDAQGRTYHSDRACSGHLGAPAVAAGGSECPARGLRDRGARLNTRQYRLPAEATELRCEIAYTKYNIAALEQKMKDLVGEAQRARSRADGTGGYAIEELHLSARINLNDEREHLTRLERQVSALVR